MSRRQELMKKLVRLSRNEATRGSDRAAIFRAFFNAKSLKQPFIGIETPAKLSEFRRQAEVDITGQRLEGRFKSLFDNGDCTDDELAELLANSRRDEWLDAHLPNDGTALLQRHAERILKLAASGTLTDTQLSEFLDKVEHGEVATA